MNSPTESRFRKKLVQTLALLAALVIATPLLFAADTRVTFEIDAGDGKTHPVTIELDETNAPQTAANFKKLVDEDFYKGIAIHRVVPNYIVQMGDPLTKDAARKAEWGTGGPGYTVPAETGQKHLRGSIAMARLSDGVNPNRASSGSQFYVCLADMPALDGDYTVFGKVVNGLEHFDRISQVASDTNNNPIARIALIDTSIVAEPSTEPSADPAPATSLTSTPTPAPAPMTNRVADTVSDATPDADSAAQTTVPATPSATPPALPSVISIGAAATNAPTDGAASSTLAMANAAASEAAAVVESATTGSTKPESSSSSSGNSGFSALVAEARAEAEKMIGRAPKDAPTTDPSEPEPIEPAASEAASAEVDADATASIPSRTPDSSDVTAELTQPIANPTPASTSPERTPVDTAGSSPSKPKKPQSFLTRIIKKVW